MTIYFLQGVNPAPTPVEGLAMAATTVLATFASPDPVGDLSASIDWGNGTTTAASSIDGIGSVFVPGIGNTPEYAVEGGTTYATGTGGSTLPITVAITDDAPPTPTTVTVFDSTQVLPAAVPFQVTASPLVATEGASIPAGTAVATVSYTPGAETPVFAGTVTFPGASPTPLVITSTGVNSFQLTTQTSTALAGIEEGTNTDTVSVTDTNNGNTESATGQLTVKDAPLSPGATQPPVIQTQGIVFIVPVATFTDANPTAPVSDFSATIDWGDGTPASAGQIIQPGGVGTTFIVDGTHTYARPSGGTPDTITVSIKDVGGSSLNTSTTANVGAAAPITGTAVFVSAVEAQPLNNVVVATFTDPSVPGPISSYSASINWGVGSPTTGTIVPIGGHEFAVEGSFTYPEEDVSPGFPYHVTVTIQHTNPPGPTTTIVVPTDAFVGDAPLSSQAAPISGTEGTPLPASTVVATFLDQNRFAGISDFTAQINWGDGTSSVGTMEPIGNSPAGGLFGVLGSHTYTDKGNYQTSIIVTDVGGSQTTAVGNASMADAPAAAAPIGFGTTVDHQYYGPVAFFFQNYGAPTGLQPGSNYTTTINWGDGSAPSLGTIVPVAGGYDVYGVHTYLLSRTTAGSDQFPVTVSIHDNGGAVTTVVASATVGDVPIIAQLDPATDTGLSHYDGITKDNQPRFFGTGEAYATFQLLAAPNGTQDYSVVGQTSSDASGAWSITSGALADGKYTVQVKEIDPSGTIIDTIAILPTGHVGPLVIDTAGPKVTSVYLDRLRGQVDITYSDNLSGLDYSQIDDSANYAFSKPGARSTAYQITSIAAASTAADPQSEVVLTINGGRPLRGGIYTLTILSGDGATGVRDVAGNALDGEFYGTFPSGNNVPGGNFVAEIDTIHNLVEAPKSVIGNASPIAAGVKPTATHIPTVNPKNAAALARQLSLEHSQLARQAAQAKAAARLAAHDAALAHASARARRR